MKAFFLVALVVLVACAVPPETYTDTPRVLDDNVQRSANAITARQTADAAGFAAQQAQTRAQDAQARAAQFSAEQTAVAQSTRDAFMYEQTRTALTVQIANVTRQAQFDLATATENARRANVANAETSQARQETRVAIQTETRRADEIAAQVAAQTRVAAYPTQTRVAEQIALDQAERARAAEMRAAQAEWDARVNPLVNTGWAILPFAFLCGLVIAMLAGMWKLFRAFEHYIKAKALEVSAPALAQMQIRDASGRPIGFLQLDGGVATFQPYFEIDAASEPDAPRAVLPLTDMQDRKLLEAPPTQAVTVETSAGAIVTIHNTDLLTFTRTILETMDWSQATWADKRLPRGFVLSKDTKNGRERVYGGYARLLQLFVDRNLIVNRRQGSSGEWNPHAPRDADTVIRILLGEMNPPPLPDDMPSPTAARPGNAVP